jgi:hypothetical protein
MTCCCWVFNRWWLCRRLVYRCLLSMAGAKPQRRCLTAQPTQRPITTPSRLQSITPQLALPRAAPPRYRSTTRLRKLPRPTTPRLPSTTLFPATTPRFRLITPLKLANTTPKCPSTTLHRAPPSQLRRRSITTQRLLLRTKLTRKTTLMR